MRNRRVRRSLTIGQAVRGGEVGRLAVDYLEDRCLLANFLVTSPFDDGAQGTLRNAINQSNSTPGPNTITFRSDGGLHILLASALPDITTKVLIDGTSDPIYAGIPTVVIDGQNSQSGTDGLTVDSSAAGTEIRGLGVINFSNNGIVINGAAGCIVDGCYVGVDPGTSSNGPTVAGNLLDGILLVNASGNTVGPNGAIGGNVISGNGNDGVDITGTSDSNSVLGNVIGLDPTSQTSMANGNNGVEVKGGSLNSIGSGASPIFANVISGNGGYGVALDTGSATTAISGNLIGTDGSGAVAIGNTLGGISINGATDTTVGGQRISVSNNSGNLISGNTGPGITLQGNIGTATVIQGNYIGTDITGATALANQGDGINNIDASNATIGGTTAGLANLISGNLGNGITLGGSSNLVAGNTIGLNLAGTALGNTLDGVFLPGSTLQNPVPTKLNTIGAVGSGGNNVISGNGARGIDIENGEDSTLVINNIIGADPTGKTVVANNDAGIYVNGSNSTIGGAAAGQGNLISGNIIGIEIDIQATGTAVFNNLIGTDITGNAKLGSAIAGISIGGVGSTIGGTSPFTANVVSGNQFGIAISGSIASNNLVQGNFVGLNLGGTVVIPNTQGGIQLQGADTGPTANTIGGATPAAGNIIAGNGGFGIEVQGGGTINNLIASNTIGTLLAGNNGPGIVFDLNLDQQSPAGPSANTISGNVIGHNTVGVRLNPFADGNILTSNFVGVERDGVTPLANSGDGLLILSSKNTISGNVLSGNQGNGISILSKQSVQNVVDSNLIGTTGDGLSALANKQNGIAAIAGSNTNTFKNNLISGNLGTGLLLQGGSANVIGGNKIGLSANGGAAIPNAGRGILLVGETGDTVGSSPNGGNTISGNSLEGIAVIGSQNIAIKGNTVGLDASRSKTIGNGTDGVFVGTSNGVTIGGAGQSANVIGGNRVHGVHLDKGNTAVSIIGNDIGTDASAALNLGNVQDGIRVDGGAATISGNSIAANGGNGITLFGTSGVSVATNVVGSVSSVSGNHGVGVQLVGASQNTIGASNVISSNLNAGVYLAAGSNQNTITNNRIGLTLAGAPGRGNLVGIVVDQSASNTIGAAAGTGNFVGSNSTSGIVISGAQSTGNQVLGNTVGIDVNNNPAPNIGAGLLINNAPGVVVRRNTLSINVGSGVQVVGAGASGALIAQNIIGLDSSSSRAYGNIGDGVTVLGASNVTIGGPTAASRNLIAGNQGAGIEMDGPGASNNQIANNYIGFASNGQSLPGGTDGIAGDSLTGLVIQNNVIGNNKVSGIDITGSASANIQILSNLIGLSPNNTAAPNGSDGIFLTQVPGTVIRQNVISANGSVGVQVLGAQATGTQLQQNLIGTDATGERAIGNGLVGVYLNGAPGTFVGGNSPADRNLISGNGSVGVQLNGTTATGTHIGANFIGLDANGVKAIPNGVDGILIQSPGTTVGGTNAGARNFISGNGSIGIQIEGASNSGNVVQGNFIGTDVTGLKAIGNSQIGVLIDSSANNSIGGNTAGAGNVVTGSSSADINVSGNGSRANFIAGNKIGTDATGLVGLSGAAIGIFLNQAPANAIGDASGLGANIIANHPVAGVQLFGSQAQANVVAGNVIGLLPGGNPSLANALGVLLNGVSANTIGGTLSAAANSIGGGQSAIKQINGSFNNRTTGNLIYFTSSTVSPAAVAAPAVVPSGPRKLRGK